MLTAYAFLSHVFTDFLFQNKKMVEGKNKLKIKYYLWHIMILLASFIPLIIVSDNKSRFTIVYSAVIIAFFHLITDYIKNKVSSIKAIVNIKGYEAVLFALDQLFHLIVIVASTQSKNIEYGQINDLIVNNFLAGKFISYTLLFKVTIIIYIALSGAYFIPLIFKMVYHGFPQITRLLNGKNNSGRGNEIEDINSSEVATGKYIGIMERVLVLIFIFKGQIAIIGFVIAAKSLARFKLMDDKAFSEYYLIGTLSSIIYTLVTLELLNFMFL